MTAETMSESLEILTPPIAQGRTTGDTLDADQVTRRYASPTHPPLGQHTATSHLDHPASHQDPPHSGQTSISEAGSSIVPVTPIQPTASNNLPPSPDGYFSIAGRPARAASLKKVRYAADCDRDGNPIKTKEEKAAERERLALKKQREKEKERERKMQSRRSNSASGSRSGSVSKSSVEPQSASGETSASGRSASTSTVPAPAPSKVAPTVERTRSGRQVTAPPDRHKSAHREARSNARKRQLEALKARHESEEAEEEEEEQSEENAEEQEQHSDHDGVRREPNAPNTMVIRDQQVASTPPFSTTPTASKNTSHEERDEMDLLNMSDEEDDPHISVAKRPNASVSKESEDNRATKRARSDDATVSNTPVITSTSHHDSSTTDPQATIPPQESVSSDAMQKESPTKAPASTTASVRAEMPAKQKDAARRSFSGKALSSLLSTASHRRPGLGRRTFIPPLHPNRKPPPPPKLAPPSMSKKEKDALKKESLQREQDGSEEEEDEDEDEEGKPRWNPFEEEIEGY